MAGLVIFVHCIVCILLIVVILMQSGRGGGLTEGFQSAENMFGAQTNSLLIRVTTVLSIVFLVTCLSLAFLSVQRNKSLVAEAATPVEPVTRTMDAPQGDEAVELIEEVVNEMKDATSEDVVNDMQESEKKVPAPSAP